MSGIAPLASARLRFRGYRPHDAAALHATLADAAAMRWWSRAPLATVAETRAYLERGAAADGWRAFYFTGHDDDRALGWVSVGEKRQGGVCEIGFLVARDMWGRGFAREATATVIDHLFTAERMRRVFADTDPDNAASRGLLESLGFVQEGVLRGEWETHIGVRDSVIYGLLAGEWRAGV